jgi:glyoxylase-like metal-dependent hydrolase (beta-lactamase superfamily II)
MLRGDRAISDVVAREPFGTLERLGDGIWALVSSPLSGDRTTLGNGGLLAGRDGVLAIEGFNTPAGARWLAEQSVALTGRWPTHVVLTHYHADHANGVAGYVPPGGRGFAKPKILVTEATRDLIRARNAPADPARDELLANAALVGPGGEFFDLGRRRIAISPSGGHTVSDIVVYAEPTPVLFAGDLIWNGFVPNFVDTDPVRLRKNAAAVADLGRDRIVPGHGRIATRADVSRYLSLLDELERAARTAHAAGTDAATAASAYALPPSLGEWTLFNRSFYTRAFTTWYRVLSAPAP